MLQDQERRDDWDVERFCPSAKDERILWCRTIAFMEPCKRVGEIVLHVQLTGVLGEIQCVNRIWRTTSRSFGSYFQMTSP